MTLPVFVLANLAGGLTSILADMDLARPGFPDAGRIRRQCEREKPDRCVASPAFFEALLAEEVMPFRTVYTGGGPVFPGLLERLGERCEKAVAVYGSTEAEPMAHFHAGELDGEARRRTREGGGLPAGRPVEGLELRVVRDRWGEPLGRLTEEAFREMEAPPGAAGEVVVSGAHVLPGYLDGEGDAETKFSVGETCWHRTGDAGALDAEGRLWLLGRCAARMEGKGGRALYPLQVEAALRERGCGRCAVFEREGREAGRGGGGRRLGRGDGVGGDRRVREGGQGAHGRPAQREGGLRQAGGMRVRGRLLSRGRGGSFLGGVLDVGALPLET